MLKISHDLVVERGIVLETAKCGDLFVKSRGSATCALADLLIADGFEPDTSVEIRRENPFLFDGPSVIRVTLAIATLIEFFSNKAEKSEFQNLMSEAAQITRESSSAPAVLAFPRPLREEPRRPLGREAS